MAPTVIKSIPKLVRLARLSITLIVAVVVDNEAAYVISTALRALEVGLEFWERHVGYKRRRGVSMLCFRGRSTAPNSAKLDSANNS